MRRPSLRPPAIPDLTPALIGAAGAAMLAASQFMDVFQLAPTGGDALESVSSADQHGVAMLVLAVLGLGLLALAIYSGPDPEGPRRLGRGRVAALGALAAGVVALGLFAAIDLPDAGGEGAVADRNGVLVEVSAEPRAGFWLELAGGLLLAAGGAWLAWTAGPREGAPVSVAKRTKPKDVAEG